MMLLKNKLTILDLYKLNKKLMFLKLKRKKKLAQMIKRSYSKKQI